jgi:hypothetical protein
VGNRGGSSPLSRRKIIRTVYRTIGSIGNVNNYSHKLLDNERPFMYNVYERAFIYCQQKVYAV